MTERNLNNTAAADLEDDFTLPSPSEIRKYLDERVIGQDDAKKTLSIAVYNHYKRLFSSQFAEDIAAIDEDLIDVEIEKSNILMMGSTGTGKTFMIKQIAKMLNVPCYIADVTKITQSGYVGDDVESILSGLLREANFNVSKTEMGIVILDEIDKLRKADTGQSITRDVAGEGVQQSLLKIIEGTVANVPPQGGRKNPEQPFIHVDTTNILFIGLGAFEHLDSIIKKRVLPAKSIGFNIAKDNEEDEKKNFLKECDPEDLKNYGFISEFVGRFPVTTYTNELTEEDLIKILFQPKNAIVKQYKKLFAADNASLSFTDEALDAIAKVAKSRKTGARALRGIMESVLFDKMFMLGDNEERIDIKITIDDVKEKFDLTKLTDKK